MQANFEYLWRQLVAEIPALPPQAAQTFVSNAWYQIQDYRDWSWREKDGILIFPAALATGTINLTKNTYTGTLDATALAAWNADTQFVLLSQRQLRLPGDPNRIFSITEVDLGTGVVTFDSLYTGETNTVSTYSLYSAYQLPRDRRGEIESWFDSFVSIRSLTTGYFIGTRSKVEQDYLNRVDRGRVNYGFPTRYSYVRRQDTGTYPSLQRLEWYEFWPHCTSELALETRYIQKPKSFDDDPDQILPSTISPKLVIYGALLEAYRWADQNRGSEKSLSGTNWGLKAAKMGNKYPSDGDTYYSLLRDHERQDDKYANKTFIQGLQDAYSMYPMVPTTTVVRQ